MLQKRVQHFICCGFNAIVKMRNDTQHFFFVVVCISHVIGVFCCGRSCLPLLKLCIETIAFKWKIKMNFILIFFVHKWSIPQYELWVGLNKPFQHLKKKCKWLYRIKGSEMPITVRMLWKAIDSSFQCRNEMEKKRNSVHYEPFLRTIYANFYLQSLPFFPAWSFGRKKLKNYHVKFLLKCSTFIFFYGKWFVWKMSILVLFAFY